ncbi:MAG: hypothetical protein IJT23_08055 [Clostridia bacterium]|nr:hypothetical protein [Clostridia bacterium]
MKSKRIISMIAAVAMICPAAVQAATVTQPDMQIYVNTLPADSLDNITSGDVTVRKLLANNSDRTKTIAFALARYSDTGELMGVSWDSVELTAGDSNYASARLLSESGGKLKTFEWEMPSQVPSELKSPCNVLSSLKVRGCAAAVDSASNKVLVKSTGISADDISDIKVSEGAQAVVSQDGKIITVTAENGSDRVYTVETADFTMIDFDSDTVGSAPTEGSVAPVKSDDTRSVSVVPDPDDEGNNVLRVLDNSTENSCSYVYDLKTPVEYPYVVSTKVRYERNNEYSQGEDDISYSWFRLRNRERADETSNWVDTNIYHFAAMETGAGRYPLTMPSAAGSSSESAVSNTECGIGQWHQVDMVCNSYDDIKVYFDGRLVRSVGSETASDVALTRIGLFTTATRKNTTYLDDIVVYPIERGSLTEAVFNVPSLMADGKIYIQASDISKVTIDKAKSKYIGADIELDTNIPAVVVTKDSDSVSYPLVLKPADEFYTDDYETWSETTLSSTAVTAPGGTVKYTMSSPSKANAVDGVYSKITEVDGNKLLKMNAGAGDGSNHRVGITISNVPSASSYAITYDVMYSIPENTTFNDGDVSGQSVTPSRFVIYGRNAANTNLVTFQPGGIISGTQIFKANTGSDITGTRIALDTWYEVKIIVKEGTATYYLDGEVIDEKTVSTDDLSKLAIWSSDNRKALVHLDNLTVVSLTEPKPVCELISAEFNKDSEIIGNTIYVDAEELSEVELVNAEVSFGAEYTYEDGVLTVTAKGAEQSIYSVKTVSFFKDDFESYDAETVIGSGSKALGRYSNSTSGADETDVYAKIAKESDNQFMELYDGLNSAAQRVSLTIGSIPQASSFILEYDVKYDIPKNQEYDVDSWNCTYFATNVRNSANTNLAAFQTYTTVKSSEPYRLAPHAYYGGQFTKVDNSKYYMKLGEWSHIKIVYNNGTDSAAVTYYLDGEVVAENQTAEQGELAKLQIFSSTTRKAVASFDNFRLVPII